jgi:uracil phosphoribosyltransferase|eukprot:g7744.t1
MARRAPANVAVQSRARAFGGSSAGGFKSRFSQNMKRNLSTMGVFTAAVAGTSMSAYAYAEESYLDRLTSRLEQLEQMLGKSGFPNTTVIDSRALTGLLTVIRDKRASNPVFVAYADRACNILAEEALARLNDVRPAVVETPCGRATGLTTTRYDKLCVVSVVRSGDILTEAVRRTANGCATGKILVQRDESDKDKRPVFFYSKLPKDVAKRQVLLCDPMLATGGSARMCIQKIIDAGVPQENITFLTVVSCPTGILNVVKAFPKVKIITGAIDKELNSKKFIVPGLGDFGDRYFNTE